MRILYHHRTRGDGAEGVHIREMGNAFLERGHQVDYCCPRTAQREPGLLLGMTGMTEADRQGLAGWFKIRIRQGAELAYNAVTFPKLLLSIARFQPDLIYERYSCYHFAGILVARFYRIPICLEVNSTYAGRFPRRALAFPRIASWIEAHVFRKSTVIAVVSRPLMYCVCDRLANTDQEKVVVTPNAINEKEVRQAFNISNGQHHKHESRQSDAVVIGFVGSLRRWHGVDMLLRQIPRVLAEIPGARFLIVGSGELERELKELANRPEIRDRVVATGGVPRLKVPELIQEMDIGLMPDSNAWGSPMKILEYMAMGKTTIAPRLPPIEEIVKDGETGILFEPGVDQEFFNAIITAIKNPELRHKIGVNANRYVLQNRCWTDNVDIVMKEVLRRTNRQFTESTSVTR